jgi:hypothetical protein
MLTLFKLFLFPRIKNLLIQFASVSVGLFIAFMTGQTMLVFLCFAILMALVYYNFLAANLSDNIEWVKNSLTNSKKLLGYYFIEQTIFAFITAIFLLISVAMATWTISKMDTSLFTKDEIQKSIASQGKIEEKMETMKSYGATEMSLELIFLLLMLLEVFYGAELVKSYFLTLKYEKKFSKESVAFQGMLFLSFIFIAMKDSYSFFWITHAKIIFIPLFMGFGLLVVLHAANEGYKLFRRSWNSPLFYYPMSLSLTAIVFCLIFSKMNYKIAPDIDKKIAEHRFQFIFAEKIDQKTLLSWYKHGLSESSMAYLVNVHPLNNLSLFDKNEIILAQNSTDSLLLLSKMIDLKSLNDDEKEVFKNHFFALNKENHAQKQKTALEKLALKMNFKEDTLSGQNRLPASDETLHHK